MAYAALDYYKANLIIERGFGDSQPNHTTLRGGKLREYPWKRMLDSVTSGGAAFRTLEWMFVLHVLSGAGSLLAWTKDE
jgi:hypothetical protein